MYNTASKKHCIRDIDRFRSYFDSSVCRTELFTTGHTGRLAARFESVKLGAVNVFRFEVQGLSGGKRSTNHVRDRHADDFLLLVPLSVSVILAQNNQGNVIPPGCFSFVSTARPYEGTVGLPPHHRYSEFVIKIPGPLLRAEIPKIDQLCALPINFETGAGRIMFSLIESLIEEGHYLSSTQSKILETGLIKAIGAATQDTTERLQFHQPRDLQIQERVRLQAKEFIVSNLSDSNLNAGIIAEHCHVSLRYLHASFETTSDTVATLIRNTRLQRCRDELVNPKLSKKHITEIAMTWGFSSSSSFSRAYRKYFRVSPSDERTRGMSSYPS